MVTCFPPLQPAQWQRSGSAVEAQWKRSGCAAAGGVKTTLISKTLRGGLFSHDGRMNSMAVAEAAMNVWGTTQI